MAKVAVAAGETISSGLNVWEDWGFLIPSAVNLTDTVIAASVYRAPGFPSGRGLSWGRLQALRKRINSREGTANHLFIRLSPRRKIVSQFYFTQNSPL
jgi:hypothetical protein